MPAKRTRGERAGLTRALVLDAALGLVDQDGLAALSMRKLGAELGVEAMTLYHYVPTKDALLDGLLERVLDQASPLTTTSGSWQQVLTQYADTLRATLLRHPGVLPIASGRPAATRSSLQAVEGGLRMLTENGFPLGRALDVLNALTVFVVGHAASEAATVDSRSQAFVAELDAGEFPLLTEAARTSQGTDDESRFHYAVSALLAGFAADRT